jgi:hypothetical protein
MARLQAAGEGQLEVMLELIAEKTASLTQQLLERRGPDALVVIYGGLLHNDAAPRPGREAWSFGPKLQSMAPGSYVSVDLIVREYVRQEPPWTSLPWVSDFQPELYPRSTLLLGAEGGDRVLILPRTEESERRPPGP